MNTARLKNIVIIILLLANAFLLVLLFARRAEERSVQEHTLSQLTELFASDGVQLDASALENLPASLLSVQPVRDADAERALAEGIIGAESAVDSGGGIYRYYSSDGLGGGVCLIRSSGALEASVSRAVDDPEGLCAELCLPLGYTAIETLTDGTRTTITATRMLEDCKVFNGALTFTFSSNTLTSVSGTLLPPIDTEQSSTLPLDAVTALVRFLDYRNASGAVCTEVVRLSGGYLVQSTASAALQLVPVLRVETDVYSYYVALQSGEVTRE